MKYNAIAGIWLSVALVAWASPPAAVAVAFCATVATLIITVIETD